MTFNLDLVNDTLKYADVEAGASMTVRKYKHYHLYKYVKNMMAQTKPE